MVLPDLLSLTPVQLKALFDQGELGKHSMGYLEEANLYHPAIWGKVIGVSSTGTLVWLPQDSTGRLPMVEENSSEIVLAVHRGMEGFYGNMVADKNPGPIRTHNVQFTSDGAGAYTGNLVASPGAGKQLRMLGLRLHGSNLAGGSLTIGGSILLTDHVAQGRGVEPVNETFGDNTAISATGAAMGNTVTYTVDVMFREEDS